MTGPQDLDYKFVAANTGRIAASALELTAEMIEDLDRAVDLRVYNAMQAGSPPVEALVAAWAEKLAYHKLTSKLKKAVQAGRSAGPTASDLAK